MLFHGKNGYTNAPQCYLIRTLLLFFRGIYDLPAINIISSPVTDWQPLCVAYEVRGG
jgi:hypothetical protein